jgi:hypothetical protein
MEPAGLPTVRLSLLTREPQIPDGPRYRPTCSSRSSRDAMTPTNARHAAPGKRGPTTQASTCLPCS